MPHQCIQTLAWRMALKFLRLTCIARSEWDVVPYRKPANAAPTINVVRKIGKIPLKTWNLINFPSLECEKDGKTYGNGEKLVNSESPCQVCYCQGGEFSCNNVTCYIRNDCEPKYIPGRCCPEYDNCPPLGKIFDFENLKGKNLQFLVKSIWISSVSVLQFKFQ